MAFTNSPAALQALRRGRLDVFSQTVACWPVLDRSFDKNSDAARRAALDLLTDIGEGVIASAQGWHVVIGKHQDAYRIACLLKS